jgi:DNA-binding transcriptional MerR regulator
VADRAHLSIGEVLNLLQDEFPEVTISKIRFLESQGLLDPERTPSGYRKFYEPDIRRLRWILLQQREHFLPLRVIKERLAEHERAGGFGPGFVDAETAGVDGTDGHRAEEPPPRHADATAGSRTDALPQAPQAARPRAGAPAATPPPTRSLDSGPTSMSLTREELCAATGLSEAALADLERYGLITGRPMGRETLYDDDAVVVANIAAGFWRFGVEGRHLRMYKVSAEREAAFFEQVVMPLLKQRNPKARRQAVDQRGELADLGTRLREALLRQALVAYQSNR